MSRGEKTFITPETLLRAYAAGVFPMAETREAHDLFWVDPDMRGIIPLDGLQISKSLRKAVRQQRYQVKCNTAFLEVMEGCAETTNTREDTWINPEIFQLYTALHHMGSAHSIECWEGDELVGGLYGVSLGSAFFGESMFSRKRDASKIALVHLVVRLRLGHYTLLDTQFVTDHLARLGAIEVPRKEYHQMLDEALGVQGAFYSDPTESEIASELDALFLQSRTHTS